MSIGIQFSFHRIGKCIILVYILLDNLVKLPGIYGGFLIRTNIFACGAL